MICYEIIFPEFIHYSDQANSNLILNISEDAMVWKIYWAYTSILRKPSFRAIENDSFLIRSANKGFSAFLDDKGEIIKILNPCERKY